jgi:hypothetical protein
MPAADQIACRPSGLGYVNSAAQELSRKEGDEKALYWYGEPVFVDYGASRAWYIKLKALV